MFSCTAEAYVTLHRSISPLPIPVRDLDPHLAHGITIPTTPNVISIELAVLPEFTVVTNGLTL